jgi:cytochrome c553
MTQIGLNDTERRSTNHRRQIRLSLAGLMMFAVTMAGTAALAQVPAARTGTEDLRPAFANPADLADGKRLAETSCVGCHGDTGISSTKGVPNLAGQRPGYLYIELKAYRAGARGDNPMANAVKFLNDDALVKVAAYFANLDPAQPNPNDRTAAVLDPVSAGKAAAASCVGCHGDHGTSKIAGTPNLSGLDSKYLASALKAYRSGQRKEMTMKAMVASLSDADIDNIALYFALEKPARAQTPAPGDQAAGKAAAAGCVGCHGELGVSTSPATPSLAGQDAQYFAAAVKAYKTSGRSDDTMKGVAGSIEDGAVKDMAAFFAAQQPQQPNVRKPLTTAEWAQRCDRCHGINGNSTDPRLPALAAQRADYLELALNAYRSGARKSSEMAAMADVLAEADVKNLAAHYSRQRARAVVFVTLPEK